MFESVRVLVFFFNELIYFQCNLFISLYDLLLVPLEFFNIFDCFSNISQTLSLGSWIFVEV